MKILNIEEKNIFTKEIYISTENLQIEVYLTFIDNIFYIEKEDIDIFETTSIKEYLENNTKTLKNFEDISNKIKETIFQKLEKYNRKNANPDELKKIVIETVKIL